jgi:hypothetical protein
MTKTALLRQKVCKHLCPAQGGSPVTCELQYPEPPAEPLWKLKKWRTIEPAISTFRYEDNRLKPFETMRSNEFPTIAIDQYKHEAELNSSMRWDQLIGSACLAKVFMRRCDQSPDSQRHLLGDAAWIDIQWIWLLRNELESKCSPISLHADVNVCFCDMCF